MSHRHSKPNPGVTKSAICRRFAEHDIDIRVPEGDRVVVVVTPNRAAHVLSGLIVVNDDQTE